MSLELLIVPVSPLNAPGLMTSRGWDTLRAATAVALSCTHPAWAAHLREAGVEATQVSATSVEKWVDALAAWWRSVAENEEEADGASHVAWLCDSEHPYLPAPPRMLPLVEERIGARIDADFVFASPVAPGSAVVESVRIMHELRSPGGDTWSAQQTHASLARYLLEETHEVLEELDASPVNDRALVAEFGDLLFQLVFHARIGMEAAEPWDLDSVARALNEKMYRRNPHVFSPQRETLSVQSTIEQWHAIKEQEKQANQAVQAQQSSTAGQAPRPCLGEGIPASLPALQRAAKLAQRARDAGLSAQFADAVGHDHDDYARELAELATRHTADDRDPESALRALLARIEQTVRPAE